MCMVAFPLRISTNTVSQRFAEEIKDPLVLAGHGAVQEIIHNWLNEILRTNEGSGGYNVHGKGYIPR